MYQPKIKKHLIRKLYFLAKREKKKMTQMLNEILEEYMVTEPDPPPYESQWIRYPPRPDDAKRKERAIHKMMRDYHGGNNEQDVHRSTDETRSGCRSENLRPQEQSEAEEFAAYTLPLP